MMATNEIKILSVSEFNQEVKYLLEAHFFYCQVEGELSNISRPQSGHVYFSLKDELASVRCVMWKQTAFSFLSLLETGTKVQIRAKVAVYVPRGEYQLVVQHMEPAGIGDLYQRFEFLKQKLAAEGLFDSQHKQSPRKHPRAIGIISSSTGAALQDVLYVLQETRPDIPVVIYPSLVQGEQAPQSIVRALARANQQAEVETLLLVRGGGSIEDLWAFNEEIVVRAIYASDIPVITGVGHETDITLADYVADQRAPTPSVAAKMAAVSRDELFQSLDQSRRLLNRLIRQYLDQAYNEFSKREKALRTVDPQRVIEKQKSDLTRLQADLCKAMAQLVQRKKTEYIYIQSRYQSDLLQSFCQVKQQRYHVLKNQLLKAGQAIYASKQTDLATCALLLDSLSPLKVLGRGYSLTYKTIQDSPQLVNSVTMLTLSDKVRLVFLDGHCDAQIETVKKKVWERQSMKKNNQEVKQ